MLDRVLKLTRTLFVLDTETTGVDPKTDRIIELGFQQWEPQAGMVKEWRSLVNPQVKIPPESTEKHHITDADMLLCQECNKARAECACKDFRIVPTFRQLAPYLVKGFRNCDYAGKRVRFDLQMLAFDFARSGVLWEYSGARIVDIDRLEQIAIPRGLDDLHEKYTGHKHDTAHRALSDVRASTTVLVHQMQVHAAKLPADLDELHRLQWPGYIDTEGKFQFVNGSPMVAFGKWKGKRMDQVDVGYYDWILSNDFPDEIKVIAANAKLGKFPVQVKE